MTDVATARPNALTSAPPLRTHAAVRAWIMASRWVLGLSYLLAAPSKIAGHEFARAAKDPAIHEFFAHLLWIAVRSTSAARCDMVACARSRCTSGYR